MRDVENNLFSKIEENNSIEEIRDWLEENIEKNIDFYSANNNKKTVMMVAAGLKPEKRAMEMCGLLLVYGGKEQICTYRRENESWITPIHDARDAGNEDVAKMLLGQIFSD